MARAAKEFGVVVNWDESQVREFMASPNGELGRTLMQALGEIVLTGAKRRALRRTGRMVDAMRFEVGRDEAGVYTDVISPVQNPKTGFPYAIMHEGPTRIIRDRRPHRSLRPALRDIRKIEAAG
jgi:hypothetical protein